MKQLFKGIKLLKGIFICFLVIFLMSDNVFAAEISETNVGLYATFSSLQYTCGTDQSSGTWYANNTSCHLGSRAQVNSIAFRPSTNQTLSAGGYFVEVYLRISNNASTGNPLWYGASTGDYMQFVSEEQVSSTTADSITYRTYRLLYRYTGGTNLGPTYNAMSIATQGGIFGAESYKILTVVFWKVSGSETASIVNAINAQTQYLRDISQNLYIADGHLSDISDYLDFIKDEIPSSQDIAKDVADEEEDRVQDSSDQAQQDADQAQQDAQQSTSSLLGVGSTIVSTIVNQPATNCLIDMTFAHYTVGNVNLCANVPSAILSLIQGLASLVIVPIIAMYALYLLNKLIGLLRGFTG